jgi:hypothetical protein
MLILNTYELRKRSNKKRDYNKYPCPCAGYNTFTGDKLVFDKIYKAYVLFYNGQPRVIFPDGTRKIGNKLVKKSFNGIYPVIILTEIEEF